MTQDNREICPVRIIICLLYSTSGGGGSSRCELILFPSARYLRIIIDTEYELPGPAQYTTPFAHPSYFSHFFFFCFHRRRAPRRFMCARLLGGHGRFVPEEFRVNGRTICRRKRYNRRPLPSKKQPVPTPSIDRARSGRAYGSAEFVRLDEADKNINITGIYTGRLTVPGTPPSLVRSRRFDRGV